MMFDRVERIIKRAFQVLRRQPRIAPAGYTSCMPTPARDPNWLFAIAVDNQGYEALKVALAPASPQDIGLMDEVIEWLLVALNDPLQRRIVSARGQRKPWKVIQEYDPDRRSIRQLQRLHQDALATIVKYEIDREKNKACRTCRTFGR